MSLFIELILHAYVFFHRLIDFFPLVPRSYFLIYMTFCCMLTIDEFKKHHHLYIYMYTYTTSTTTTTHYYNHQEQSTARKEEREKQIRNPKSGLSFIVYIPPNK